jgi:hypothetical protein
VRNYTDLWERPRLAHDISQFPGQIRVPGIRHLLDGPDGTVAIDGYEKTPLDIVDAPPGSYNDLNGQDCPRCRHITAERETAASALS